jgi:hypothetical protein
MRSVKVLEMINDGRIEELKAALQDEIYQESLKRKPNAKKRYSAMKKYFSYTDSVREVCQRPCVIEFEGEKYTAFTNSYTLAITTEPTGEIELFDESNGTYPDVTRLLSAEGEERKINFSKIIAEAKSQGYKLRKAEMFSNHCLLHYDGSYFRIALIDTVFGIIDDGEEATVYHVPNSVRPMTIVTSLGRAVVMPIRRTEQDEALDEGKIIVEVGNV